MTEMHFQTLVRGRTLKET